MINPIKYLRWIACLPCGLIAGGVIAGISLVLSDILVGHFWITGLINCLAWGLIYPSIVYHIGLAVAPSRDETSRNVMLFANWLLLVIASIDLTQIYIGSYVAEPDFLMAVSDWWATLAFSLGTAAGCWWVSKGEVVEASTNQPQPVGFDWNAPTNTPPVTG